MSRMLQLAVVIVAAHVIVLLLVCVACWNVISHICNAAIDVFHSGFSYKLLSYGYG